MIKACNRVSSSSTSCHLLFSLPSSLEAFPTTAGNNQRLLLGNSLWISSFQFYWFKTIPVDEIKIKRNRCDGKRFVVRVSIQRRSWIMCRYKFNSKAKNWKFKEYFKFQTFFAALKCKSYYLLTGMPSSHMFCLKVIFAIVLEHLHRTSIIFGFS